MSEPLGATSIVAWIRQTAERYGNRVAATGVGETLTFEELWSRSMRLAHELVARGIQAEDRVGIWAEQSCDLLVGFVGIMAAGAAYVPLDPSHPKGRLERIAADAGMDFVVVPHRHREGAAELRLSMVPTTFEATDLCASTVLPEVGEHHAAYVMFTSGSTGRPKGVVIEHLALVSLLRWLIEDCGLQPGDRVMGTASPAYDASVPTFFLPLVTGGTFISLAAEVTVDPYALADAIAQYRPHAMQTSPTMLQMLTETGWKGDDRLELWVGGDQIAASSIHYIAPRVRELFNYYGPTETTVQVTAARLSAEDTDAPVGIPPRHVGCFVLDPDRRQVPAGTTGELFLSGPTLARGYLDRPELTAERFVDLTIDGGPSFRAYRTGDLARVREDGSLLILGRLDDQIKIRGYLFEPHEVEVRLVEHPQVHEAVVLAEARGDDEPRIVAYVRSEGELSARSVRAFVRQALPDHMVPAAIVGVTSFPLTPNGKIDRRAVAEQQAAPSATPTACVGMPVDGGTPSAPEVEVLRLFASALSVPADTLGVDDDFFDVGGTSLRCARLFMSIEARYGVALPLSTLVDAPTPRRLSKVIATETSAGEAPRREADPPQHAWERILGNLWSETLMLQDIRRTDDFFALGGSDDDARRMLDKLRADDVADLNLDELRRAPTIVQLASLIAERTVRSSLVPLKTTGTNLPFFCIAGAGGLAVTFTPLSRLLGAEQPFYGLQAKGIERRGIPDYTLQAMARRYAWLIRDVQPSGPYLIGGHSLGGAIALRVVHLLEAAGERVALLAVFDAALTESMVGAKADIAVATGERASRLSDLPRRPSIKTILRLPLTGIVPQHGIAQFVVFGALGQLQVAFARQLEPWDGSAVVFVSDDDESDGIEAAWGRLLKGPWSTVSVPGKHISMLEKSNIAVAAIHLREQIAAVHKAEADRRRDVRRAVAEDAGGAPVPNAPVSEAAVSEAPVSEAPVTKASVSKASVSEAAVSRASVSKVREGRLHPVDLATVDRRGTVRSSLVPLKTTGTNLPFFCIAGAGGLAVTFTPLSRLLGAEQPFYGLQAKGIERRGIPDYTLQAMARRYAWLIRDVQPSGPYLIGGHSLGGAIALRVVHLLEAAGERVALLAVFDAALTESMVGAKADIAVATGERASRLSDLPRRPSIKTILRLPLTGIVPQHGIAQFVVFGALGQLQVAFARQLEPWDGSAVVFVSDDDESDGIEAAWGRLLKGPWSTVSVPGKHISMLEKSNIAVAAIHLREQIAAVHKAEADRRRDVRRAVAEDAGGAPVPNAPVSEAAVSEAPVSEAPVSEAPVTKASVSKAPVSKAPVSKAPASKAPASKAPASKAPASKAPASKAPASKAPVSKAPVSKAPVSKAPVSKAPVSKAPVSKASVSKASVSKASVSKASVSKASVSKASVSKASVSKASVSKAQVSNASVSDASVSDASVSDASVSDPLVFEAPVSETAASEAPVSGPPGAKAR